MKIKILGNGPSVFICLFRMNQKLTPEMIFGRFSNLRGDLYRELTKWSYYTCCNKRYSAMLNQHGSAKRIGLHWAICNWVRSLFRAADFKGSELQIMKKYCKGNQTQTEGLPLVYLRANCRLFKKSEPYSAILTRIQVLQFLKRRTEKLSMKSPFWNCRHFFRICKGFVWSSPFNIYNRFLVTFSWIRISGFQLFKKNLSQPWI